MIIQITASVNSPFSRVFETAKTNLNLISSGTSTISVQGAVSEGAPLMNLFSGTLTTLNTIDLAGIVFLQITVSSGDPIYGSIE